MPPREYSTTRDPFVTISVLKDKGRSFRKKTHLVQEEFTTKTVRHSLHPKFNETFTAQIKISEFKVQNSWVESSLMIYLIAAIYWYLIVTIMLLLIQSLRLKLSVFDMDRHTKTTEIAATTIPLKDIKLLVISEVPVLLQEPLNDVRHVSTI